ncbi:hypothetical protein CTheo_9219 [Ceratobasidium theobromae]|uniref:Uncharacterized protein n=1 Tax=Ceratobasidium theobromae TaxID=1582974 RepID=A0A5N5Q7E5_9AGAM|nr:hypothetical protein CTheo_9219 [Ceratobasidium theobromae]
MGEQRSASWWNGLISEKSEEWKDEYDGPSKAYLSWVAKRISELNLVENLTNDDKERLAKQAAKKRAVNKETKISSMTRKRALVNVQSELEQIFKQFFLSPIYGSFSS